jgi:hypothetical protein
MFTVADQQMVMAMHLLASIRQNSLGAEVASLLDQRDVITAVYYGRAFDPLPDRPDDKGQ